MRFRVFFYACSRILFGSYLVVHAAYNVFDYSSFLVQLDMFFSNASFFSFEVLEALAPLVPFVEFIIGSFLLLGFFTKPVLLTAMVLFSGTVLFLLDVKEESLVTTHITLFIVSLILFIKDDYNPKPIGQSKDWLMRT
ncbi:DoxX family membrane protein [Aquimarina intermedia]|uniref:DoxX-like protein n=1 Tax=Aquimarina intermedia TaxID=350814 RepID=A0A5S5C2W5_9FLAO|nr:DoxX family membrane protein [Aquimarina intermedia]TYP72958.1 DoxX-like protein [Aquimarina intermedia]